MMRLAPRAGGGERVLKSRRVRLSRPMEIERWLRSGSRMAGGEAGSGGISCRARRGEGAVGSGGRGSSIVRYHGVDEEASEGVFEARLSF